METNTTQNGNTNNNNTNSTNGKRHGIHIVGMELDSVDGSLKTTGDNVYCTGTSYDVATYLVNTNYSNDDNDDTITGTSSSSSTSASTSTSRRTDKKKRIICISFDTKMFKNDWLGLNELTDAISNNITLVGMKIHNCNTVVVDNPNTVDYHLSVIRQIISSLQDNKSIVFVDLSFNKLRFDELITLIDSLQYNNTVKRVYLRDAIKLDNNKKDSIINFGKRFNAMLEQNSSLEILEFCKNIELGDDFLIHISNGISQCTSLRSIDFLRCSISNSGTIALANALQVSTTTCLNKLILSCNNISDDGAIAIGELLRTNESIQYLFLDSNSITDIGATAIADSIYWNNTLLSLSLDKNRINDNGIVAIAKSMYYNSSITRLALGNNQFTDIGIISLTKTIQRNETLKELRIIGVSFSKELHDEFRSFNYDIDATTTNNNETNNGNDNRRNNNVNDNNNVDRINDNNNNNNIRDPAAEATATATNETKNRKHFLHYNDTLQTFVCDHFDIEFGMIMKNASNIPAINKGCSRRLDTFSWLLNNLLDSWDTCNGSRSTSTSITNEDINSSNRKLKNLTIASEQLKKQRVD